jgi:hypothetical protein
MGNSGCASNLSGSIVDPEEVLLPEATAVSTHEPSVHRTAGQASSGTHLERCGSGGYLIPSRMEVGGQILRRSSI